MNPDLSKKVVTKIEDLCKDGCSEVKQVLSKNENGMKLDAFDEFNESEIELIIDELNQIMSVYENKS